MNSKQIALLNDEYMKEATRPDGRKSTLGEYVRFITDSNIEITSSKDMIVMDNENELIHSVSINEDMRGQADFPVKVISTSFDRVACVECVMSNKNFKEFLNSGFLSGLLSSAKKEFMVKWVDNLRIAGQHIEKATPYYDTEPKVVQTHVVPTAREDGLVSPVSPASLTPVPDSVKEDQQEAIKQQ